MDLRMKYSVMGIYKITSPRGGIYIGQSICIYKRFLSYRNYECKQQIKLHKSLIKHTFEKHTFEIVEECSFELLNERERYWQDYYDSASKEGLNLLLTKTSTLKQKVSEETKLKISFAIKGEKHPWYGRKHSEESKNKMRGQSRWNNNNHPMLGKHHSKETKEKQSNVKKGKYIGENSPNYGIPKSEDHKKNMLKSKKAYYNSGGVHSWTNRKHSEESKQKMSESKKGKPRLHTSRLVLNLEVGIFYSTVKEASFSIGVSPSTLRWRLDNPERIKTPFVYCN